MIITGAEEQEGRVTVRTASLKKYFRELFTADDRAAKKSSTVLDVAPVNKHEIYLAIEERDLTAGEKEEDNHRNRRVFARLCLPLPDEDDAGGALKYRVEEETDPPTLRNCPLRILTLLTPTDDVGALRWRLACYEKQVEDARRAYDETKAKYAAVHYEAFRHYVRKSGEAMVERRFLILHQALSGAQTVTALLERRRRQEER